MLFDSHTHLLDEKFNDDRDKIIGGLAGAGICAVLECGTDMDTSRGAAALAQSYESVYAAVGVHPHDAKSFEKSDLPRLRELANQKGVVAIGEIGLDFHYDFSPRDAQKNVFEAQMALADEIGLPVVIHSREATNETLEILRAFPGVKGVWHSFTGSADTLKRVLDLGYSAGFGGAVTFKNAKKPVEAAKVAPRDRVLIETDCPYLTPSPHRGKRNEPKYARVTLGAIAGLRGENPEDLEVAATKNAYDLFGISRASN